MEDYIERLGNFEAEAERRMDEMVDALLKMHPSAQECCDFALQRSTHLWQNVPEAAAVHDAAPWNGHVAPAM